jgi:predicted nuclease with RNAse H fold
MVFSPNHPIIRPIQTVIGIDVGGERKGFHAVALRDDAFVAKTSATDPAMIVDWCLERKAIVIAVDAPSGWSKEGLSREVERILGKQGIHCFATPTRDRALHRDFYKWVFNGEKLYECLAAQYPLFDGQWTKERICIETFPHAIICAMAGQVVSARPKSRIRREALRNSGYDDSGLPNIDFVDAALCAVAANEFRKGSYKPYGDSAEGFIVVPSICVKEMR